jgi:hypothetical protein
LPEAVGLSHSEHGNIGSRIATHQFGDKVPAVLCRHLGGGDLCNHVIGRQDVSMLSIDDDARAGRLKFPFQLLRDIEKFPK